MRRYQFVLQEKKLNLQNEIKAKRKAIAEHQLKATQATLRASSDSSSEEEAESREQPSKEATATKDAEQPGMEDTKKPSTEATSVKNSEKSSTEETTPKQKKIKRQESTTYPPNVCRVCYRERQGKDKINGYQHLRTDPECQKHPKPDAQGAEVSS